MEEAQVRKVADRLRRLCSRREYCSKDILRKATDALEGDKETASAVLAQLVKERYVDDLRYATAFSRDKASISGWGATKIRYALSVKGVSRDVIDEALREIDESSAKARLDKLLENKYKSLKDDPQCRLKLLRFALGRGYSYDEVETAVRKVME